AARWLIERTAAARRAGLDSLFLGDHHASPTPYYQNTPMLGRLLAEWGDAPAGCLFLLPLWNPVLVAEHIGTLASIATGPFIMQCGLGYGEAQFAARGATLKTRPSAFEESLDIVRRLLAGETVSSARRFTVTKASIAPRPPEPVDVWIGASAPPAIDRAARLADGWVAVPSLTLEQARGGGDVARERWSAPGRRATADVAVASRSAGRCASASRPRTPRRCWRRPWRKGIAASRRRRWWPGRSTRWPNASALWAPSATPT